MLRERRVAASPLTDLLYELSHALTHETDESLRRVILTAASTPVPLGIDSDRRARADLISDRRFAQASNAAAG